MEDVGNNFFLQVESIGRPKAVETSRWLSELNDGVDSAAEVNVRFYFILFIFFAAAYELMDLID